MCPISPGGKLAAIGWTLLIEMRPEIGPDSGATLIFGESGSVTVMTGGGRWPGLEIGSTCGSPREFRAGV
jgi:hypothetical protein